LQSCARAVPQAQTPQRGAGKTLQNSAMLPRRSGYSDIITGEVI